MGAIDGQRVVGFAALGPAALASMLLVDMGVEVIRVERPELICSVGSPPANGPTREGATGSMAARPSTAPARWGVFATGTECTCLLLLPRFARSASELASAPVRPGEDGRMILGELGLQQAEIEQLQGRWSHPAPPARARRTRSCAAQPDSYRRRQAATKEEAGKS